MGGYEHSLETGELNPYEGRVGEATKDDASLSEQLRHCFSETVKPEEEPPAGPSREAAWTTPHMESAPMTRERQGGGDLCFTAPAASKSLESREAEAEVPTLLNFMNWVHRTYPPNEASRGGVVDHAQSEEKERIANHSAHELPTCGPAEWWQPYAQLGQSLYHDYSAPVGPPLLPSFNTQDQQRDEEQRFCLTNLPSGSSFDRTAQGTPSESACVHAGAPLNPQVRPFVPRERLAALQEWDVPYTVPAEGSGGGNSSLSADSSAAAQHNSL